MIKSYYILTEPYNHMYYIEDHTNLFGKSTWKIRKGGEDYLVLGIGVLGGKPAGNILAENIQEIKQFLNRQAFFSDKFTKDQMKKPELVFSKSCQATGVVKSIGEMQ